jgi:DNA helicase-2/ATP-dependent DNA helicase PcrA
MIKNDAARFVPQNLIATDEQVNIQLSKNKVVIIQANAGAAKTTTLALRLGEAIARKLEPENMLALVFTPEARDVLKKRLVEVGIPQATAARIHVATFEDFSSETLSRIEQRNVPMVSLSKDLKEYVIAALENVSDNFTGKVDFLDIQTHNLAISQFIHAQLELKAKMALQADFEYQSPEEISERLGVQLAEYLGMIEYEQIRLGHDENANFRGPFDATYDLARMLGADSAIGALLPRYRLIICDELHDLNEASFKILQHLIFPDYSYFVGAGDSDQVIHSRLGASEEFMNSRFRASYPATVFYPLTYSYRHGPHLAYTIEAFKGKSVDSTLPLRTEINQLLYDDAGGISCADQVIKTLERWKKLKQPLDDCAILIRDKHQSIPIENALMQAGIAYRTNEMKAYLQREEILFLRGMIAIALNNFSSVKSKKIRADIFDSLVIFAEVTLAREENIDQFRQAVVDDPEALMWFFSARVERGGLIALRDKLSLVVDAVQAATAAKPAEHALAELRQQLAAISDFLDAVQEGQVASQHSLVLAEVKEQVSAMTRFLESRIMELSAQTLLQSLSNSLRSSLNYLVNLAQRDVRQRMANVVQHVKGLEADAPAHIALAEICQLMHLEALARRLYVHAYDAKVVTKSVAGFIAAAEKMQMNLRQFSEWIGAADEFVTPRKAKNSVLLECVANAKGKEFEHVILPFLEKDEFPVARADSKEEENLFYVAATRTKSCLTLICPKDETLRSPYIARLKIVGTRARADAAVARNASQLSADLRVEFKASGDDWAVAKALGAHWDFSRKIFYLKSGQDTAPFARWLR